MPRQLIKKYLPTRSRIRELKLHLYLGNRINDKSLWILNRQSASRATAIGLFCAYIPLPVEMLLAALLSLFFRANLPVAILLVWVSNPLTWIILYTPPYLLGLAITGGSAISLETVTLGAMTEQFAALFVGCIIFCAALAGAGYILSNVIWRMMVANRWTNRRKKNGKKT